MGIPADIFYKLIAWVGVPILSILGIFIYGKVQKSKGKTQGRTEVIGEYLQQSANKQGELHKNQTKHYENYQKHINQSDNWTADELRNAQTRHGVTDQDL